MPKPDLKSSFFFKLAITKADRVCTFRVSPFRPRVERGTTAFDTTRKGQRSRPRRTFQPKAPLNSPAWMSNCAQDQRLQSPGGGSEGSSVTTNPVYKVGTAIPGIEFPQAVSPAVAVAKDSPLQQKRLGPTGDKEMLRTLWRYPLSDLTALFRFCRNGPWPDEYVLTALFKDYLERASNIAGIRLMAS